MVVQAPGNPYGTLSKTVESSKFPVPTNSLEGDSYKVDLPLPTCLLATHSQDVHKNIHTFTYIGNIIGNIHIHYALHTVTCMYIVYMYTTTHHILSLLQNLHHPL